MPTEPYTSSQTLVGISMTDKEVVVIFTDEQGQPESRYQYTIEAARRVAAAMLKAIDTLEGGEMSEA